MGEDIFYIYLINTCPFPFEENRAIHQFEVAFEGRDEYGSGFFTAPYPQDLIEKLSLWTMHLFYVQMNECPLS